MSEGQDLKFQGGPTPKPEGDQRNHCGQDRKHVGHDKAVGAKVQCFQGRRNYEQAQRFRSQFLSIHRTKSMARPNIRQVQCPATPPKVPTATVPSRIPSDAVTLRKLSVFIFSLRFASTFDARHSNLTRRQCRAASLQWFDSGRIVHIDYPSEITANCRCETTTDVNTHQHFPKSHEIGDIGLGIVPHPRDPDTA